MYTGTHNKFHAKNRAEFLRSFLCVKK